MKNHNFLVRFFLVLFLCSALYADVNLRVNVGNETPNSSGEKTNSANEIGTALVFNGMELSSNLSHWAWGGSSFALEIGAGNVPGRNAMRWIQGDEWGNGWTGVGVTAFPAYNLSTTWQTDTATITLKVDAGVDTLRIQYEGGGGKVGTKFKPIADGAWHTYKFPLRQMVYQDNTSGFDSSNINVVGIMSNANSIIGKVIYITDWWTGHPVISFPAMVFNGIAVPARLSPFTWGQSVLSVEVGGGPVTNSNALKWVQGNEWNNGWTGMGFTISPGYELGGAWSVDSVTFKLKCDAGVDTLRIQFESGVGKVGKKFKPIADGAWHTYKIPLRNMVLQDNTSGFDSSNVTVIGMMAEATGIAGKVIYITDWWTGHPNFDVFAPNAPIGITAFAGTFQNIVTWVDVPGEVGEKYNIYYSLNPITDVNAPGVEVAKLGVPENFQLFEHLLFSPAANQSTTYYYAVTCIDAAGNSSASGSSGSSITNLAKGVPSFSLNPPSNFIADGNLIEWNGIAPIVMKPSDGSGHIVANTTVSSDVDLTVKAYLAMDQNYMYVAFNVDDDIVVFNATQTSYLNDCADLYVGLYNWHGMPHFGYQRGAQPDYHFRFAKDRLLLDGGVDSILLPGASYYWQEKFPSGYVIEAKIPLTTLAQRMHDSLFVPQNGKRLPLDFGINDADATGSREGIMTYSPYNEDQSWNNVSRWLYNWIGNLWMPGNPNITWQVDNLLVADNGGHSGNLTFGQSPIATNGLDTELGEAVLPPPPPSGIFDVRFELPVIPAEFSSVDFRNTSLVSSSWLIRFQPGAGGYPVTLSWNPALLPDGFFIMKDVVTGSLINVNMKQQNFCSIGNTGITAVKIEYAKQVQFPLLAGWNIVSVPVVATNMATNTLFPQANSPAYGYNNGYQSFTTLSNGKGYWIRYPQPSTISLAGSSTGINTVPLNEGWNLIGGYENNAAVSNLTTTPSGILSSQFYGYNTGYLVPDTLKKGKGYWIRASQAGVLNLTSTAAKEGTTPAAIKPGKDWTRIIITDRAGSSMILYCADRGVNTAQFELPPMPPDGIFDVRFASNKNTGIIGSVAESFNITSAQYPVTITVEGGKVGLQDKATNGKLFNQTLTAGQKAIITDASVNSIEITAIDKPASYDLSQNFPNPFNPSTTIRFALPEKAEISLTVYNQIGEKVAVLTGGEKESGYHSIQWNAGNMAAGVYFYELKTEKFRSVKKLVLMK